MNARTAKLLRSYARSSGITTKAAKREWLTTPKDKRGAVRAEMEANLWRRTLQEFRQRHNLQGKGAADVLHVPYDTWRAWESMKNTPPRWAMTALKTQMRLYQPGMTIAFPPEVSPCTSRDQLLKASATARP